MNIKSTVVQMGALMMGAVGLISSRGEARQLPLEQAVQTEQSSPRAQVMKSGDICVIRSPEEQARMRAEARKRKSEERRRLNKEKQDKYREKRESRRRDRDDDNISDD